MNSDKNIFLIGMMGSGKSSVGKRLSTKIGHAFYDSDEEIEKIVGLSISKIFKQKGEAFFRSQEEIILSQLCSQSEVIVGTGGGSILNSKNRDLLRDNGVVIYLKCSVDILYKRLKGDSTRPLLEHGSLEESITEILKSREDLYTKASHFTVDTSSLSLGEVVEDILIKLKHKS